MAQHPYRFIRVPVTHPLARANSAVTPGGVPVHEHRIVLWDKIGPGRHPCHWCGRALRWAPGEHAHGDVLTVDHINRDGRDNRPKNLVPSCHGCNAHRSRRVPDGELFLVVGGKRRRAAERVCRTCGKTFLVMLSVLRGPKKNPGRYCSRRCLYARPR